MLLMISDYDYVRLMLGRVTFFFSDISYQPENNWAPVGFDSGNTSGLTRRCGLKMSDESAGVL